MEEPTFGRGTRSVVEEVLRDVPETLVLVTTSEEVLESVIEHLSQGERKRLVSILSNERTIKQVVGDFAVGSVAADLVESDRLSLHVTDEVNQTGTLFTNEDIMVTLVEGEERTAALINRDDEFTAEVSKKYATVQTRADAFSLRTPPLSQVRETLAETFDESVLADFDTLLDSQDDIRGKAGEIDEVGIALLVAAKHQLQLYEVSKWGESNRVASKATFSRAKNALEDDGLIETEKIPIDVGRPRQRLMLANDQLRTATAEDIVEVAETLLEEEKSGGTVATA